MKIGTVSDERYVALADVILEFEGPGGSTETRSRASGSVYAELAPGEYLVSLQKAGYGSKRVRLQVARDRLTRPGTGSSVTDIALDCGFVHLGRFSGQYRQAYGELPSETLARARA